MCQVRGTSIQQSNDNFTVCTKLKILNFKATRTEFPVLCIGNICCTLITLTICACLGCEILAPMCENNQWQRWWTVWRQFDIRRIPGQTAGLHQLPAQHCSEVYACTIPYLWCALSEETPENVHLRQCPHYGPFWATAAICTGSVQLSVRLTELS